MNTNTFELRGVFEAAGGEEFPPHASFPLEVNPDHDEPLFVGRDPDLWLYRDRTTAMLRRYFRLSIEVGRVPSLLGREFFRTRVTSYRVGTFEDSVIFVHDVERCMAKLSEFEQSLVGTVLFQDFSHDEAARMMGCWRRTVGRRLPEVLDHLSDIFLNTGLLARLPAEILEAEKSCQEAKNDENELSDCE